MLARTLFLTALIALTGAKATQASQPSRPSNILLEFRGRSLEQHPCHFVMNKKDGAYQLSLREKDGGLLDKKLKYEYEAKLVDARLLQRQFNDRILLQHNYGTPSREAFTRFELVFVNDVLREVHALKYKNLNYRTKSKALSCLY